MYLILLIASRNLESGMSEQAFRPIFAESCQIIRASYPLHMSVAALGPMLTKASGIVWTLVALLVQIYMAIHAFCVGALAKLGEKVTLGHTRHVKLVQVLAELCLFAKAAQPMLADN